MKLSFAISLQETSFDSVGKGEWKEIGQKMSKIGYDGIEVAIKNPFDVDINLLAKFLYENNLELSAIGTGQAYFDEGLSLTSTDLEKRKKAITYLKKHMELGSKFNAVVIIGLIRGKIGHHQNNTEVLTLLSENIKELDEYAETIGAELAIEPINRYETDLMHTALQAANFIRENALCKTGILLDTFHMNIEESQWIEAIDSAKDYLKYIHISDSNRRFPGCGHIDFSTIITHIKKSGYKGFYSGEMLPLPNLDTALYNYYQYMKRML